MKGAVRQGQNWETSRLVQGFCVLVVVLVLVMVMVLVLVVVVVDLRI